MKHCFTPAKPAGCAKPAVGVGRGYAFTPRASPQKARETPTNSKKSRFTSLPRRWIMSGKTTIEETHMPRRSTPPITLPEYERLFRTIHAVVANEQDDPTKACLFFAVAGAYLLKRHHKLSSACPVAGVAGYNLRTPTNFSMVFGKPENDTLVSDTNNFHCWVEVEGWVIDLMAPLFDEMAPADRKGAVIPRFMFQKPVIADVKSISLDTPGATLHIPNDRLTTDLMRGFTEKTAHSDLVRVCDQWYARPPKKIAPSIGIEDRTGKATEVFLSPVRIAGVW